LTLANHNFLIRLNLDNVTGNRACSEIVWISKSTLWNSRNRGIICVCMHARVFLCYLFGRIDQIYIYLEEPNGKQGWILLDLYASFQGYSKSVCNMFIGVSCVAWYIWMTLDCFMMDMHMWRWLPLGCYTLLDAYVRFFPWSVGDLDGLVTFLWWPCGGRVSYLEGLEP